MSILYISVYLHGLSTRHIDLLLATQSTENIDSMWDQCWASIADDEPTLAQHYVDGCCLVSHHDGWPHNIDNPAVQIAVSPSPKAVDWCICFTRKIQHCDDWERSRPQGQKNVHNFLLTVRPLSWACEHGAEMLLILKKLFSNWLFSDIFRYDSPRKCPTILYAVNLWLKPVTVQTQTAVTPDWKSEQLLPSVLIMVLFYKDKQQ